MASSYESKKRRGREIATQGEFPRRESRIIIVIIQIVGAGRNSDRT